MSDETPTEISSRPAAVEDSLPPFDAQRAAVVRCADAWFQTYKATLANGESSSEARRKANEVYRLTMPPLIGYENIRDFIACTAHGMLLGAIDSRQSTKLLYAAQVTLGAVRKQ